jgi:hypothetical protein
MMPILFAEGSLLAKRGDKLPINPRPIPVAAVVLMNLRRLYEVMRF